MTYDADATAAACASADDDNRIAQTMTRTKRITIV